MAKVTGLRERSARMKRMSGERAHRKRMQTLFVIGQTIELDAELSITQGSISGKDHVPSAPGEAPNRDTGGLDTNIETTFGGANQVHVTSNAPYSAALEFGTSKMAERPFMRPAVEKNRGKAAKALADVQTKIQQGE